MYTIARAVLLSWVLTGLVVSPALAQTAKVQAAIGDAWITTKIQAAFFLDKDVKSRTVDVTTRDGVVTLTGIVATEYERDQALQIARTTDGVKRVVDKLMVRSAAPTATTGTVTPEKREPPKAEEPRGRTPGTDELARITESDLALLTQIKTKLAVDTEVSAFAIDVDVDEGIVTLTGKVKNEAARQRALSLARSVQGVKSVKDRLRIEP